MTYSQYSMMCAGIKEEPLRDLDIFFTLECAHNKNVRGECPA